MSPVPSIRSGQMTSTALVLLATLAVVMVPQAAFAQAADFTGVQESIGRDFTKIPKAVAVLSYVFGVFFGATGLVRMKLWMHDPERNKLISALYRLVVASLLIWLPFGIVTVNTTLFGTKNDLSASSKGLNIPPPQLTVFGKS